MNKTLLIPLWTLLLDKLGRCNFKVWNSHRAYIFQDYLCMSAIQWKCTKTRKQNKWKMVHANQFPKDQWQIYNVTSFLKNMQKDFSYFVWLYTLVRLWLLVTIMMTVLFTHSMLFTHVNTGWSYPCLSIKFLLLMLSCLIMLVICRYPCWITIWVDFHCCTQKSKQSLDKPSECSCLKKSTQKETYIQHNVIKTIIKIKLLSNLHSHIAWDWGQGKLSNLDKLWLLQIT